MPVSRQRKIVIQIDGSTTWEVARDPDSGVWIGVCRELQLNAAGETHEEVLEGMMDAMRLFFDELVETGKFYDFLQRHGWAVATQVPVQRRNVRFDLPFNLKQKSSVRELAIA